MKTIKKTGSTNMRKKIFLVIIILFHIGFSIFIWYREGRFARENTNNDFQDKAIAEAYDISQRLEVYSDVLYSLRGLFADDSIITKYDWDKYMSSLNWLDRYPGIAAVSYIHRLKYEERDAYLDKLSAEYFIYDVYEDGIAISPENDQQESYVISYFEPFDNSNKYIGFDLSSQPERLRALTGARDSGLPSATSKVKLLNDPNKEPSLVIYLPIYDNNLPVNTVAHRRDALIGFVSVAFKMESIMSNVFSKYNQEVMNVEIYDVTDKHGYSISNLLYDSDRVNWDSTKYQTTVDFQMLDRNWKLLFTKEVNPDWIDYEMRNINLLLLMSLVTGSLLIFISYDRFK